MKKIFISFSLILALATLSLQPVLSSDPITVNFNNFKKDDRIVKNFNGVAAGGPINVIITLGNTEGLRFEGDADAIATLISEVKGSILIIRPQNSWTSWARKYENKKITAYVSAKMIKSLTMSGSGNMSVTGLVKETGLAATLSGSGSISANVNVNNFNGVISGSGNLNFSGHANDATITISGSGSLTKKGGLAVGSLSTVISGSGSVNINADNKINAVISGSGSVNYSGNASVEKRVVGSGSVRKTS
ncbi:MAG: head GIN domain-containing protein [Bacteroidota bacterium]